MSADVFLTGARDGRALLYDLRIGSRSQVVNELSAQPSFICHQAFATIPHDKYQWATPCTNASSGGSKLNVIGCKRKRVVGPIPGAKSVTGVAFLQTRNHIATSGSDG